ncbi:hypothetical protein [Lentilactobacillus kefiri]|uniref:hypothetical protein n=1 Tax=Lentilactobacillus kefiri TaxID=33962 RepID=UPI00345F0CA9
MSKSFWDKFLDVFIKPEYFCIVLVLAVTIIVVRYFNMLPKYDFMMDPFLVFLIVLVFFRFLAKTYKKHRDNEFQKFLDNERQKLVNDPLCWKILIELYRNDGNPVKLHIYSQKVQLLENYLMISKTTNSIYAWPSEMNDPLFPYVLQPVAEYYISRKLDSQ